jgi:hypothetical protein
MADKPHEPSSQQPDAGPDFDDIELELVTSSREASMSFVPFAESDVLAASSALIGRRPRHLRALR